MNHHETEWLQTPAAASPPPRLQLAEVAGRDDDASLEGRQPQAAHEKLATDDRGDHPAGEDPLVEEDDQRAQHEHLVGHRVE
jgi:hypothetical protein